MKHWYFKYQYYINMFNVTCHFMIKPLGYILTTSGLVGFFFFINYNGTKIPLRELWFVVSIFLGVYGAFLIVKQRFKQAEQENSQSFQLGNKVNLKKTGEVVRVTLDDCVVKTRSYQEEVQNDYPLEIRMLDGLYDSNRNYKTSEVQQTYIVYYKRFGNKTYKYVSPAVNTSADALKRFIVNRNGIDLYIDKTNPQSYYYDLPVA
jgi:hypothetical protein